MGFGRNASLGNKRTDLQVEDEMEKIEREKEEKASSLNKMTIIIFSSVIAGMALGYLAARPFFGDDIARFDHAASLGIKTGLCFLMAFVGLELGLEGNLFQIMRRTGIIYLNTCETRSKSPSTVITTKKHIITPPKTLLIP